MNVFIGWSGGLSHKIALELRDWIPAVTPKAKTWVSSADISIGLRWNRELRKELRKADYGIFCIVPGNVNAPWPIFEAGVIAKYLPSGRICPYLFGLTQEQLNGPLGQFQCAVYTKDDTRKLIYALNKLTLKLSINQLDKTFNWLWPALKSAIDRLLKADPHAAGGRVMRIKERSQTQKDRPAGVVSPEKLLESDKRLTDEVFAIELLSHPVELERGENGHVTVTVNRNGVRNMLYSNAGKMAMTERYVTPKNRERLMKLDREVQSFIADGGPPDKIPIDLPDLGICLRWASGGILSIVTDTNDQQWVPLFFRDIRPYGWNIALGTTERWFDKATGLLDDNYNLRRDLNYPHTFIMREFLEETLIVTGDPQEGGTLYYKSFHFPHRQSPFSAVRAKLFYKEHCDLRKEEDHLTIIERGKTEAKLVETNCSLIVRSDKDYPMDGVLICFSLLDLGIEIVEVAEYNLEKDNWILDGEIREVHNAKTGKTKKELIRMPTALLSREYLRDVFGPGKGWHNYTCGPQPSIEVSRPPVPEDEIKFFDWDVKRRMQAIEGEWDAKDMKRRYIDWYDKFGQHFIKDREKPEDKWKVSHDNPSRLFVPGTAKILNL
jgi:hypothetical protein